MFDTILLPVDLNHEESWAKALPIAQRCAGSNGTIHLLGIVHDLGSAIVSTYLPENFEQHAMEHLKAGLADLAEKEFPPGSRVEVHVAHGHVAETILRIAGDLKADLIVMSSHPPNDLRTLLIGSQADKVVRHAELPVLVVR